MRDVPSKTPPGHREWASAALKAIFAQENRESAMAKAGTVAGETEERKLKSAANRLRGGVGETAACLLCVCSIESGPCERVESLQMSGRF